MNGPSVPPVDTIRRELERLDLLLHRQILRLRKTYELSLDEFRGLYVSDEQVDGLLAGLATGTDGTDPTPQQLLERAEILRRNRWTREDDDTPWQIVTQTLTLTPFEEDVLILALAPEIALKYEVLYGYLNNDVSRKWPTRDLALRLFAEMNGDYATGRHLLTDESPLLASGALELVPQERPVSWLAAALRPAPGLVNYLLGQVYADPRLGDSVRFTDLCRIATDENDQAPPDAVDQTVGRLTAAWQRHTEGAGEERPMLVFEGIDEAARREACHRFARGIDAPLLEADLRIPLLHEVNAAWIARLSLYQRLTRAVLVFHHCQALFDADLVPVPAATRLFEQVKSSQHPVIFASGTPLPWPSLLSGTRRLNARFDLPALDERKALWRGHAGDLGITEPDVVELAGRYVLTGSQIRDAVAQAWPDGASGAAGNGWTDRDTLAAAVRTQSNLQLARLATRVDTPHVWGDLVLANKPMSQLREVAQAIRNRHVVYHDWGFARRVVAGQGIKVLFAGASGTGKTMAAGVMANDLGLDLYAIDLSSVVSKYIGETERNLDRVFRAAENSNAILFFDEADALYGKRSEIKDAHDRYANIEVSYLLQKVEAHEGAVILATNLKGNIDEAFSRRMHYVIDFPKPKADQRRALWMGMFPARAPLRDDVDFTFLAEQFEISGGEIKNAVLDAAFLGAQDGGSIGMDLIVKAVSRQIIRKGSVPSRTQFKQYYDSAR